VVAAIPSVYSLAMPQAAATPVYRVESRGAGERVVIRGETQDGAELIVIAGYRGPKLPVVLTRLELAAAGAGTWRLSSTDGRFDFEARGVDRIALRPALYKPLHGRFALSRADRIAVRVLLGLLRFPGGTRILRWWQRHR